MEYGNRHGIYRVPIPISINVQGSKQGMYTKHEEITVLNDFSGKTESISQRVYQTYVNAVKGLNRFEIKFLDVLNLNVDFFLILKEIMTVVENIYLFRSQELDLIVPNLYNIDLGLITLHQPHTTPTYILEDNVDARSFLLIPSNTPDKLFI